MLEVSFSEVLSLYLDVCHFRSQIVRKFALFVSGSFDPYLLGTMFFSNLSWFYWIVSGNIFTFRVIELVCQVIDCVIYSMALIDAIRVWIIFGIIRWKLFIDVFIVYFRADSGMRKPFHLYFKWWCLNIAIWLSHSEICDEWVLFYIFL